MRFSSFTKDSISKAAIVYIQLLQLSLSVPGTFPFFTGFAATLSSTSQTGGVSSNCLSPASSSGRISCSGNRELTIYSIVSAFRRLGLTKLPSFRRAIVYARPHEWLGISTWSFFQWKSLLRLISLIGPSYEADDILLLVVRSCRFISRLGVGCFSWAISEASRLHWFCAKDLVTPIALYSKFGALALSVH